MSSSETIRSVLSSPFVSIGNRLQTGIDWVLLRAFGLIVRGETAGHLHLTLPSGRTGTLGTAYDGRDISITLNSYGVLWSLLTRGSNGFAENYMNGHVDCESLHDLFGFYLDNAKSLSATDYGVLGGYWRDRLFHRNRRNTRAGSRRNIAAHYDLGNEFYRLWLDPSMTYSSAIYSNPKLSLEAAQQEKFRRILDGLDMKAGQSVLEIGCGWGGFAEAAARRGANVTGITISQNNSMKGPRGLPTQDWPTRSP